MYLVTGGAGFIGSHIVRRLVALGKKVRVLDNFSFGKRENLQGIEHAIELRTGDLLDPEALRAAMDGVEVVFHQGAIRSVPLSVENPTLVSRVNVEGTLNILMAARETGVRRVVYASSSSVYGNSGILPMSEEHTPNPISPYAASKLAGEYYCRIFTHLYGLETVSLRYFNVYGPRQDPNSQYAAVIPRFIECALQGKTLVVHGDGLQSRDFTFVANVVDANLCAAETQAGIGGVFNVGQGRAHTLLDLIDFIRRALGVEPQWRHTGARPGDVRHTTADLSRAARLLGYRPGFSFEEGLRNTVAYFSVPRGSGFRRMAG